jgi:hypothetical protein
MWEAQYDIKKLTHSSLQLRSRLNPTKASDCCWNIGHDEKSGKKELDNIWKYLVEIAFPKLENFNNFPTPFSSVEIVEAYLEIP